MDTDGFKVGKEIAIFHNRRKYINRLLVLHLYTQIEHCTVPWTWKRMASDCCGGERKLWRQHGRHPGRAKWPYHLAIANDSACSEHVPGAATDGSNT